MESVHLPEILDRGLLHRSERLITAPMNRPFFVDLVDEPHQHKKDDQNGRDEAGS